MAEDLPDHRGVLDTRDHPDLAPARRAGLDLEAEHPFQPLRPAHGPVPFGRRA